tara:strand:- start:1308 stop:4067 length:2760 start_codon:yes stop_codon:yes gene_type:complete
MTKVSPIQNNFNGGEISSLLYGRPEVDRYKTGLKTCLNFIPLVQGPVERRPGTVFMKEVKTSSLSTRIVRFEFSTTQAYILEVGNLYARFYKDNGAIIGSTTTISGATKANPCVVTDNGHPYTNGQEIYITGVVGMTELNGKYYVVANKATNTYELTDIDGTNVNSTAYTTYGSAGTSALTIELVTTYVTADLFQLKFTQSADTLYITHPTYPPRKITRTSDTVWTITNITFLDGPYLNTNTTATTLTLSATSGSVTVTASAVTGINGGDGFLASDIGRQIRWEDAAGNWTFLTITARANTTSITATIDGPNASATTATITWRLGVWSITTGYPTAVTFHQNRLCFAGPTDHPQRLDLSRTGDFENFTPTDPDGTVVADHGVTNTLSADTVNAIRWLASDEKGLLIGTVGGEWILRASDTGIIVTPINVQSTRSTAYGSANITPLRAGRTILFLQRAKRKIRELAYIFEDDGFRALDTTLVAEHITRTGVVDMAYQAEPQSLAWTVLADGTLNSLTYERDQKVIGWARHIMGGVSDAGTTQAKVESVAVIPNTAGDADELYMIVRRHINGATRRYIEYLKPHWEETKDQEDAFFVDSGLSLDVPLTITSITSADPAVVTSASHGIPDGSEVRLTDVVGMTEVNKISYKTGQSATNTFELFLNGKISPAISGATAANPVVITAVAHGLENTDEILIVNVAGMTELNGKGFTVANKTANTFQLSGINGSGYTSYTSGGDIHHAVDATVTASYTAYVSGGKARIRTTAISGLDHLEGQVVSILAEGSAHAPKTVSSGAITLDRKASKVHVGKSYNSDFEMLRLDAGAKDGTAQGKLNRIHRVIIRFLQTLGGSAGPDVDNLSVISFREGGDRMDTAVSLFNGDVEIEWDGAYSSDNHIFYRQAQPLPVTIEAVMPQLSTQDR